MPAGVAEPKLCKQFRFSHVQKHVNTMGVRPANTALITVIIRGLFAGKCGI